ncbi:uncharacterized protein L201_003196 [Kwoniella dendrophila CBS 6074]|uniref:histone acetyltransferase n=1 Tax=Kwoniella dendrophila CBS 6074 TaxID=1295534 RepID=A0AAX4JUV1_9TREE
MTSLPERNLRVGTKYVIERPDHPPRVATVLNTRVNKANIKEAYISFAGQDKRLDIWVKEDQIGQEVNSIQATHYHNQASSSTSGGLPEETKRNAEAGPSTPLNRTQGSERSPRSNASTPEREHAAMTRVRNFEDVRFGEYLIKTWYYSPYPLPSNDTSHTISQKPHTPHSQPSGKRSSSASSSKKRKLDFTSTPVSTNSQSDPMISGIENSHKPHSRHSRTVNDMYTGVGKGGEGARGRLWVCDLCFKYMKTRTGWERHTSSCTMLQPPGRKVYQRGSYTIWEVNGANATLYCQNLSLFGKLFIDHKSVFFHVENFLFYVICDAATSRRDQVMAFFSKEKISYDDYNLACIVTFPPFQGRGFGKLLIEFSYYLTRHPSTRPISQSPGTPERPLSDLGLKGYTAYWISIVLRFLKRLLKDSDQFRINQSSPKRIKSPSKSIPPILPLTPTTTTTQKNDSEGRTLRIRKPPAPVVMEITKNKLISPKEEIICINDIEFVKTPTPKFKGQYSLSINPYIIAKACHLRLDDVCFTLSELGLLSTRRTISSDTYKYPTFRFKNTLSSSSRINGDNNTNTDNSDDDEDDNNNENSNEDHNKARQKFSMDSSISAEWRNVEIVITKEMIEDKCEKHKVREKGVLEDEFVLL